MATEKDPAYVVGLLFQRMQEQSPWFDAAERVVSCYEGRLKTVDSELDEEEEVLVANLIVTGIDQTGMRIASTSTQTRFFPEKPGQHRSEEAARDRAAALGGVSVENARSLLTRLRARRLVALAKSPVLIRPMNGAPMWEPRDPFSCFPAPSADPDGMMSDNCVFAIKRPWWWCMQQPWAERARMLKRPKSMLPTEEVTIVEYIDGDTWGMYAAAPLSDISSRVIQRVYGESYHQRTPAITRSGYSGYSAREEWLGTESAVTLIELDNRAELCPVVEPRRITLGGLQGQFDQMVGIYKSQAKLAALHEIAITESVFQPVWFVQRENEQLEVVVKPDPRRGVAGQVKGGDPVFSNQNPGFQVFPMEDRLERAQRLNGGVPADYGGESGDNIRTARRGAQVLEGVIDFPIQEAQEILARSEWHENQCWIAVGKGFFGSKVYNFGAKWRGRGKKDWTFGDLFPTDESTEHEVKYPYAGTDLNGSLIRTGQKISLELISKQTAREDDPEIDDPELEKDRIDVEALEVAFRGGLQQQLATGALDPAIAARMIELIASDRYDMVAAYQQAKEEEQTAALEAQQAAPIGAAPGGGPAALAPGAPPATLTNMRNDLGALRLSQMSTPQEQRAEVAAAVGP